MSGGTGKGTVERMVMVAREISPSGARLRLRVAYESSVLSGLEADMGVGDERSEESEVSQESEEGGEGGEIEEIEEI